MQSLLCTLALMTLAAAGVQDKEPAPKQKAGKVQLEELLGVDNAALRKDEFARLKAMSERYGTSVQLRLKKRVDYLDANCGLTDKQRRRLEVATRGPARTTAKQLLKRVEATADLADDVEARKQLAVIKAEIDRTLLRPFESSFWVKTVGSTLTKEQTEELERNEKAREEFQRKAWVYRAVDETDRAILLTITQRDQLLKRLADWIGSKKVPDIQRGRRGPWMLVPEDVITDVIMPELDQLRKRNLIAVAPHRLRESLTKSFSETK